MRELKTRSVFEVFALLYRGELNALVLDIHVSCSSPCHSSPQIMIIDASEMLADLIAVVTAVAEFAGLPAHTFVYDPSKEHKTGCTERDHRSGRDYFIDGGRLVNKYK